MWYRIAVCGRSLHPSHDSVVPALRWLWHAGAYCAEYCQLGRDVRVKLLVCSLSTSCTEKHFVANNGAACLRQCTQFCLFRRRRRNKIYTLAFHPPNGRASVCHVGTVRNTTRVRLHVILRTEPGGSCMIFPVFSSVQTGSGRAMCCNAASDQ